ncbi:MAG: 6,7-dimethyl-8-ribityllumazine synthase, partial [Candidatus Hinthialibacter sp.]
MAKTIEGNLSAEGKKFGIVVSRFNSFITERLLEGALDALARHGARDEDVTIVRVPGSYEMPLILKKMAAGGAYDALIALSAIIRGDT